VLVFKIKVLYWQPFTHLCGLRRESSNGKT